MPACISSNNPIQLKQWRLSLNFYNSLISKYNKINSIFINGINDRIIDDYMKLIKQKKPDEILELIRKTEILKEAQLKANNEGETFSNIEPYDPSQGTLYTLSGGGKFRTKDSHPEYIAAQLEQPRFKNCQFLVQLKKGGSKKGKLYKCTKKNGKICSVVKHY